MPNDSENNNAQLAPNGGREVDIGAAGRAAGGAPTPILTIDSLQRYVEAERSRNRQALIWTSTLFLFIVLLLFVVFVSVGIHVVRRTRETAATVAVVRAESEQRSMQIEGMSDRIEQVADLQGEVRAAVDVASDRQRQSDAVIRSNIERFGQWVAGGKAREERARKALESRLYDMEGKLTQREGDMAALKEQYADLQASLAALASAPPAPPGETGASDGAAVEAAAPAAAGDAAAPAETNVLLAAAETPDTGLSDAWIDLDVTTAEDRILEELGALQPGGQRGEVSVVTFPNGDRYEGEFQDGLFHGWGVYYDRNGDRYEGEFRNDMKDGRGTFTYANGDRYIGEFRNDMQHGRGSLIYMNGDRYVGEFANGMREGKGTMLYANGNRYAGDFRNGLKHGNGVFRFANGDEYKGEFQEDLRHGKGTYTYANGARYIGEFVEGRREGKGRYIYAGGEEYIGEFEDGKKHGHGVSIYPNGMRLKGLWREDRFVRRMD